MSQMPRVKAEKLTVPTAARSTEETEGQPLFKHWKGLKMRHE